MLYCALWIDHNNYSGLPLVTGQNNLTLILAVLSAFFGIYAIGTTIILIIICCYRMCCGGREPQYAEVPADPPQPEEPEVQQQGANPNGERGELQGQP